MLVKAELQLVLGFQDQRHNIVPGEVKILLQLLKILAVAFILVSKGD